MTSHENKIYIGNDFREEFGTLNSSDSEDLLKIMNKNRNRQMKFLKWFIREFTPIYEVIEEIRDIYKYIIELYNKVGILKKLGIIMVALFIALPLIVLGNIPISIVQKLLHGIFGRLALMVCLAYNLVRGRL